MPETMDDILSDKPAEKPVVEKTTEVAETTTETPHQPSGSLRKEHQKREFEAQGRDPETGKFLPKEEPKTEPVKAVETPKEAVKEPEKPAAPQQEEMTPKEKAAFAKAADETRKRQALEARLRELEAKITQPQANPSEPPKTFWDDPEGALNRQKAEIQQAIVGTKLQTSESIARSRYKDFDEKVEIFRELATTTPGLAQQMLMAPDPAEFAYRTAANHKSIQDAGGVDALLAKAREEERVKVRAELEKELNDKAAALAKERAALPGSLSEAQSKGSSRPVWSGPTPMSDIIKG